MPARGIAGRPYTSLPTDVQLRPHGLGCYMMDYIGTQSKPDCPHLGFTKPPTMSWMSASVTT